MRPIITKTDNYKVENTNIFLISDISDLPTGSFETPEMDYITQRLAEKSQNTVILNKLGHIAVVSRNSTSEETDQNKILEKCRKSGESLLGVLKDHKIESVCVVDCCHKQAETLAFGEGMVLGNYQFLKYRKDRAEKESVLNEIEIFGSGIEIESVNELNILCKAVYACRSLINEPLSTLNAEKLSLDFEAMAVEAGIKIEILNKQKIEALKMGGLLAVNLGSIDPPTFSIMEYKPENAVNAKPIVFVGKGVVYDTGGLSLKPSASMETMKCDMSGSAAVTSALYAIALAKLPVYVVALAPATDNRPDGNAYVPGDIITMMDGTTVEVLNTDAEGRMILADALTYAKKYDPLVVIDMATLTGAAEAALGKFGMAGMHNNATTYFNTMVKSGFKVGERIAEFPFWDDYEDLLKSEIADMKNIGGRFAGAITAGKFLQHFTDYPWIHLDIAGPAFLEKRDSYRTSGGTGVGVRLLFDFVKEITVQEIGG
ncbi:MAG: leucyl aminopeptidase family protein [Bacteroidales bacterium]